VNKNSKLNMLREGSGQERLDCARARFRHGREQRVLPESLLGNGSHPTQYDAGKHNHNAPAQSKQAAEAAIGQGQS
jgi:hypothetical protein